MFRGVHASVRSLALGAAALALVLAATSGAAPADEGAGPGPNDSLWRQLTERARAMAGDGGSASTARDAGASTCSHDPGTQTVQVAIEGSSETLGGHALRVGPGGTILFSGSPCEGATVHNTDQIVVTGTPEDDDVVIDLRGGPFEPGATPETEGISEIEFFVDLGSAQEIDAVGIVGTLGRDRVVLGQAGVGLNGDGDADVEIVYQDVTVPVVLGLGGNDLIRARGGFGTGAALRQFLIASGGPGRDRMVAGAGVSVLLGGRANDALLGGRGIDILIGQADNDLLRGRRGRDELLGNRGSDALLGGPGPDTLAGGRGPDFLRGGRGNDLLHGGPGGDSCRPGPGRDRLASCER